MKKQVKSNDLGDGARRRPNALAAVCCLLLAACPALTRSVTVTADREWYVEGVPVAIAVGLDESDGEVAALSVGCDGEFEPVEPPDNASLSYYDLAAGDHVFAAVAVDSQSVTSSAQTVIAVLCGAGDDDGDALSNADEFAFGTDPWEMDTDLDGMPDGWEAYPNGCGYLAYVLDPLVDDAAGDPDLDGLTNFEEYCLGTDPANPDTDMDGMPDGWEAAHLLNPADSGDAWYDADGDGLSNADEFMFGSDPQSSDADGDGMPDGWETGHGLDPLADDAAGDPDQDGLTNLEEYCLGTDPQNPDTDADGMPDGWEAAHLLNPADSGDANGDADFDWLINLGEWYCGTNPLDPDTDMDGMPDGWEVMQSGEVSSPLDPLADDADDDPDQDGLTNLDEFLLGTGALHWDTDSDGMPDGWELEYGFSPLYPGDGTDDSDQDGLTNFEEYCLGTDPANPDTDADGMSDGWEVEHGLNPLADDADEDPDGDGLTNGEECFCSTSPWLADSDGDGLDDQLEALCVLEWQRVWDSLGGHDPHAHPAGSPYTFYEHVFYSGAVDGEVCLPESSGASAVLKVTVSGTGTADLIVDGDSFYPLIGISDATAVGAPPLANTGDGAELLIPVPRGRTVPVAIRRDDGLAVTFDSDDFTFGELPSQVAGSPCGWIVCPFTNVTEACLHWMEGGRRGVFLSPGEGCEDLSCSWTGDCDVSVVGAGRLSATLICTNRPANGRSDVKIELAHTNYLFGCVTVKQPVRYCPEIPDDVEEDVEEDGGSGGSAGEWSFSDIVRRCPCGCEDCRCYYVYDVFYSSDCGCGCAWCCNAAANPSGGESEDDDDESGSEEAVAAALAAYSGLVRRPPAQVVIMRDGETAPQIEIPAPTGGWPSCCPCPSHASNGVAVASCSPNLSLWNVDGTPFVSSAADVRVDVRGERPSSSVGDARAFFAAVGEVVQENAFTVLGLGFDNPSRTLAEMNRLSSQFGVPMPCGARTNSLELLLRTDVLLSAGYVRLKVLDAPGRVRAWAFDREGEWKELVDSRSGSEYACRISSWRREFLVNGSSEARICLCCEKPGAFDLEYSFAADASGGEAVRDSVVQRVTAVTPPLLPDYDRDGRIGEADVLRWSEGKQLYFWSNDDTWRGDDAFAGYESGVHLWPYALPKNKTDMVVNGRNDLVNLCPFAVDVSELSRRWGNAVVCEFVTGCPGDVRFTAARTQWANVRDLVRADQRTIYDEDLHAAGLLTTASGDSGEEIGYELPEALTGLGAQGAGVIAAEFVTPGWRSVGIRVRKRDSGEVLFDSFVNVRVLDVHAMYRWVNLDHVCGEETDAKYADRQSVSWPDGEHADANVVFVHGYNVHPDEAWDWSQAMFKRLWWSGMDAGFTAVLWRGNESQVWVPGLNAYATKNYHQNVLNAFRTAGAFSTAVNALPGARKYMIAHSLGNMLVSAARQDHGLGYEKYFMLNAAVAVEAYDADAGVTPESKQVMTPPEWRGYLDRVMAPHWYELFPSDDERNKLTWKGRFNDVDKTVNFYSTQDEVVANGNDEVDELLTRKFAWYNQEMYKGSRLVDFIPEAGWKFGWNYLKPHLSGYGAMGTPVYTYRPYNAPESAGINSESLKTRPLFRDFTQSEIYGENGSAYLLSNDFFRWRVLSHGIPAESFATGANPVPKWDAREDGGSEALNTSKKNRKNVDMATVFNEHRTKWIHSYFIKAPLLDTHQLYDRIVKEIR